MNRRLLAIGALAVVLVIGVYWFGLREGTADPRVQVPQLAATIGEGDDAVGVTGNGAVVRWLPLPEEPPLPRLPLDEVPKGGRLRGPALEQVRVLAAVPTELRPFVESSHFGESGVGVDLAPGVEIIFGDSRQARQKWNAAAAVLADPSVTAPSYVDVQAPNRPAYDSAGSELPAPP